ncbi:MAG: hypothetical protein ACOCYP_04915 [Planctomycetota bacterium]
MGIVADELQQVAESCSELEYGSRLVELAVATGDAAAVGVLWRYRDILVRRRPEDDLAGAHFDEKIAQADAAITELQER